MLDLKEADVLVVGAGPVGSRKAKGLADCGARVTVVAPEVHPDLAGDPRMHVLRRTFEPADVSGRQLVVTATGVVDVDTAVHAAAVAARIWVNSADDPERCTFILPAVLRHHPVIVSVSTGGASPALAQHLRDLIGEVIGPEVAAAARDLAAQRAAMHDRGESTENVDWSERVQEALAQARAAADQGRST